MKILFLCHRFPYPPNRGGKIRPFHMLRHLGRVHQVTVASLVRTAEEAEARHAFGAEALVARAGEIASRARAFAWLPTPEPSSMGYFHSPRLAAAVRDALARHRYDLICVHCSSMAPYVAGVSNVPKMLDFADMDSQKWLAYAAHTRPPMSLVYALEGRKLQRREAELSRQFDLSTCATAQELATLRSLGAPRRSGCFANGVDTEYFAPTADPYDTDSICFLGRMDYLPNIECMRWFCAAVLPRLRRRRPRATLTIVGAAPTRAVRQLARQPGVVVTGTVADVRPTLRCAALSVAPLRIARGMQNKVLESLAAGVPVVGSPLAARGIDAIPGEHLLVAHSADDYVEAITRLLEDAAARRRLARQGRDRMLSHHRWERSMRVLDRLIDECVASRSRPAGAAMAV